ncbi:retrovirus-related Pol polyprotein from transposon 17.6 [Trichonephila clavipes]|nr:retrovirus-related Pol polyprotein from transposon 17.6 [Trichonephila clavipes]
MEEKQKNYIQTPINKGTAQFVTRSRRWKVTSRLLHVRKKQIQQKKRQHFKIVTDCSAFQKTMQKKELITRIARWALQLEEFDYEIEHRAEVLIRKLAKGRVLNPISLIPLSTVLLTSLVLYPPQTKVINTFSPVVDAFTKFTWLYPVKTVSAESALEKLKQQQKTFGNPIQNNL